MDKNFKKQLNGLFLLKSSPQVYLFSKDYENIVPTMPYQEKNKSSWFCFALPVSRILYKDDNYALLAYAEPKTNKVESFKFALLPSEHFKLLEPVNNLLEEMDKFGHNFSISKEKLNKLNLTFTDNAPKNLLFSTKTVALVENADSQSTKFLHNPFFAKLIHYRSKADGYAALNQYMTDSAVNRKIVTGFSKTTLENVIKNFIQNTKIYNNEIIRDAFNTLLSERTKDVVGTNKNSKEGKKINKFLYDAFVSFELQTSGHKDM